MILEKYCFEALRVNRDGTDFQFQTLWTSCETVPSCEMKPFMTFIQRKASR